MGKECCGMAGCIPRPIIGYAGITDGVRIDWSGIGWYSIRIRCF